MNDLWVLDTSTFTWKQVIPTNDAPEARSFHRMVCVHDSLYVFGGCGAVNGRLNDLHRFDISTATWYSLGSSSLLRGRGGPSLFTIGQDRLAVVAGFAGEETNDGHVYNFASNGWENEALTKKLEGLRPRSVCCGGTLSSVGVALLVGGEVDPSDRGHEGAGGFENDIVVLDSETGAYVNTIPKTSTETPWPQERGWADAAACDRSDGTASLFIFGGLSGDDAKPERLNDLWRLDVTK